MEAAKERFHVVTDAGDIEKLTLPAAWLHLRQLGVAGRVDRVASGAMNEPGRVTVASRTVDGEWTLHPGAQGPVNDD